MRFSLLIVFVISCCVSVYCQPDTTHVPFVAYWQKGDTMNLRVIKIKKTWNKRLITQQDSTSYLAHFEVIDSDTGSYTIKWSFPNYLFDLFKLSPASREKMNRYKTTNVIYKTDELGVFTGIENWKEISAMVTELVNESVSNAGNHAEMLKAFEPFIAVYRSKRGIEQLVFNELMILHFPFGHNYVRGEVYNYTEMLSGLQEGVPVKANGIILVKNVDFKSKRCQLVQRLKILPDTENQVLKDYFKSMEMRPEAIGGAVESSKFQVSDNNIYNFYYNPGFPISITVKRDTEMDIMQDKIRQTDMTIIERID